MKLHELLEKRAAKVGRMRALQQSANDASRDLTDGERSEFDSCEAEVRALDDGPIKRARSLDTLERNAPATPLNDNQPGDFATVERRGSLRRAIAIASGMEAFDGAEKEIHDELERRSGRKFEGVGVSSSVFMVPATEKRVMTTGGAGVGLVPTEQHPEQYIDALRANIIVGRLGATVLSNLHGNVGIPKNTGSRAGQWLAEGGALTAADGAFGSVAMGPKNVGTLVEYTRNLLLQSSPDIETLIRNDFAASLAVAVDRVALNGGATSEPLGIIKRLTDASAMGTLSDASWEQVLDFIARIEIANAATGRLGWAVSPNAVRKFRTTPKTQLGSPVEFAANGFVMDAPDNLAGYVAASTTSLPHGSSPLSTGTAIFGDWSSLLIGYWSGIDILANPYESTAYAKGNVQVRGLLTADVAVRHIESFQAAIDIPH